MRTSKASAAWNGTLKDGDGKLVLESTGYEAPYSFATRFQQAKGTNPEELIGASLAGCFSMALSLGLSESGASPQKVETSAEVTIAEANGGFEISEIVLHTKVKAEGIGKDEFHQIAEDTKDNCPVSQALRSVKISLQASLE